ncbi:MAG: UDP-N-acetylmuramoyl-tripeptide--D-alanyl-D-alanine ligase [Candidatus Kerfeldbacteria bacterium]
MDGEFLTIFILTIQILIFLLLIGLKNVYWIYIWQLKEYRTDRMVDFLTTRSGKRATLNVWTFIEIAFLIIWLVAYWDSVYIDIANSLLFNTLVYLFFAFLLLELVRYLRWRVFPTWTSKAMLLSILSPLISIIIAYVIGIYTGSFLSMIIAVLLIPLTATFIVLLFQPLASVQKQRIIRSAKEKLASLSPTVIGITGSYGKTSTKQFLQTILDQRFKTISTPKNVNVDIGVAQTILSSLTDEHEVFIVEMGAYRPGEIDAICDLTSPIIGILTAINEQHLALFGSLEAIRNTKAELLASLPKTGLAVVNKDISSCVEASKQTEAKLKLFSTQDVAHTYATDIEVEPHAVQFMLHIGKRSAVVRTSLHGEQVISSILAAATAADHLGMSIEDIAEGIKKLKPVEGTMHLLNGRNHFYVIDDHYNSNPDGFMAAVDYLTQFEDKKKIVITPGMQELGVETDKHHRNVGTYLAKTVDQLIITKKDFAKPLRDAAKQGGMQAGNIIVNDRPKKLISSVLSNFTSDDVVLIEGRVQDAIFSYLTGTEK